MHRTRPIGTSIATSGAERLSAITCTIPKKTTARSCVRGPDMFAILLGVLSTLSLAQARTEFTTGAIIRFPSDNEAQPSAHAQQPAFNGVQGLRYFATGPLAAQSQYPSYGAAAAGAASPSAAHAFRTQPGAAQVYNVQPDNVASASAYDVHEQQKEFTVEHRPSSPQNNHPVHAFSSPNQFPNGPAQFHTNQKQYSTYPPNYPPQPFPPSRPKATQIPYNHQPSYSPVYKPSAMLSNHQQSYQPYRYITPSPMQAYGPPKEVRISYRPRKPAYSLRPNGPKYHQHKGHAYPLAVAESAASPAIYGTPWMGNKKPQGHTMPDGMPFNPEVYNTITEQMLGLKNHRSSIVEHTGHRLHGIGGPSQDKYFLHGDDDEVNDGSHNGVFHKTPAGSGHHNIQPSRQHYQPADLAGGRSAGSSWLPMHAAEGAVPARAYHIPAPDLSLQRHFAAPDAGPSFPEVSRLQRTPQMTEKRVGESGNSEEVVSAVVLVKQKK